jgi:hypothetical protein
MHQGFEWAEYRNLARCLEVGRSLFLFRRVLRGRNRRQPFLGLGSKSGDGRQAGYRYAAQVHVFVSDSDLRRRRLARRGRLPVVTVSD